MEFRRRRSKIKVYLSKARLTPKHEAMARRESLALRKAVSDMNMPMDILVVPCPMNDPTMPDPYNQWSPPRCYWKQRIERCSDQ